MDLRLGSFDWSLIQAFLAVAETGSFSGAARRLGTSQPTVGRQVQALEQALGTALFHRRTRGMEPTESGAALIPLATAMREAANAISLSAAGGDLAMEGTVRITASVFVSHHVLPPILSRIRQEEPGIELELVATDESENLIFREADIAIRMYRPTQLDIVATHLGDVELGLYAARSYLDRRGRPATSEDLADHDFVGYDRSEQIIRGFRSAGWTVDRHFFATRCDHQTVYWELVRAGCGLGFSQRRLAETDPTLEEVDLGIPLPSLPVWLAAPEAMRRTPRLRRVWDMLEEGMKRVLS